jgi:hypothetical protein
MKKKENIKSDFHEKVIKGLELTYKKLIQTKIEKDQSVVIMRDGKIITIKAADFHKL